MELPSVFDGLKPYILPAAVVVFLLFRQLRYKRVKSKLPQLIKDGDLVEVDANKGIVTILS